MRVEGTELWLALAGGLLISLATSLHLHLKGRITGMSGLMSGVVGSEGRTWKIAMLSGMTITSCVFWLIFKFKPINNGKTFIFSPPSQLISGLNIFGFALAGLLVGVGTCLGSGCTSGHGVCGLPRLSIRSYIAVGVFMVFGMALATFRNYVPFLSGTEGVNLTSKINYDTVIPVALGLLVLFIVVYYFYMKKTATIFDPTDIPVAFVIGAIFASGLIISGMIKREKVLGFLTFSDKWDPSLGIVFAAAVIPNFISFFYILKQDRPVLWAKFEIPTKTEIDLSLVGGATLFGLGWGLGGICPGPAYVLFPLFTFHVTLAFVLSFVVGYFAVKKITAKPASFPYVSDLQEAKD